MNKSIRPTPPNSSQGRAFDTVNQSMSARPDARRRKQEPSLTPVIVVAVGFLCFSLGLLGFAYYRNITAPIGKIVSPSLATPIGTPSQPTCQNLIEQAISYTGQYCDHIAPNKACYGNVTIQAQMISDATQRFAQRGDIADMSQIQSISAAPLNLTTSEWGIAIFRVLGNVPGTVPGETATLMVFGNTKLDKPSSGLDSFYFSSELGQIACEKVPMDGLMISMPEGAGWTFKVNGTKLTLVGNASLTATKKGDLLVSLYKGVAAITSLGQTQYFGAGQSVSVKLGGADGTTAISAPSEPQPLSPDQLSLACTMTGRYCTPDSITQIDAAEAQALLQSGQALTSSFSATPVSPAGSDSGGSSGSSSGSNTGNAQPTPNCYGSSNPKCTGQNPGKGGH